MKPSRREKVLIGPSSFADIDKSPMERLIKEGYEVINNPFKRRLTKPELLDLLKKGVTGIIAGLEPLDSDALRNSTLKVISRCGTGLSNVDLVTAKELGIKVYFTPDAATDAVAELTVGVLLSMLRMVPQMDRDLHDGKWNKRIGGQLKGKTVAIIGFGRIGRMVANLLTAFGARIIAVDPNVNENTEASELMPLDKALEQADIITIHSSGENTLIGNREFKLIKEGVFLLNAARGPAVDEKALIQALEDDRVKAAWLDTFETEPYAGPLTKYPQVILTPHVGSYTLECRRFMEMEAVNNLISAFGESKYAEK